MCEMVEYFEVIDTIKSELAQFEKIKIEYTAKIKIEYCESQGKTRKLLRVYIRLVKFALDILNQVDQE
jgi:hypothetical protein